MVKRIFLFLLVTLFCVTSSSAATVYAKTVSGVVYYDVSAVSCADVTAADTASDLDGAAAAAGAGGTLYICEGNYSGTEIDAADGVDTSGNLSIIGSGHRDSIIIDGSSLGDDIFNIGAGTVLIENITIQGSDSGKYGIKTVATTTINDVHVKDCSRGLYHLTTGSITANRLEMSGGVEDYGVALALTSATDVFNNCIFRDGDFFLEFFAATTATFNHCLFTNLTPSAYGIIYNGGAYATTATFNNCIFYANGFGSSDPYVIFTSDAGTWTLNNTFYTPSPKLYDRIIYNPGAASVTINNSIADQPSPRWQKNAGFGIAYFFIDDALFEGHWEDITDIANAYGFPTSMALTEAGTESWTGTDWSRLAGYLDGSTTGVANGLSIHGHSNAYLWTSAGDDAAGTVNAFTAYKGSSSIVVTITRTDVDDSSTWSGTLQLDALGALDLTNASYDEMPEIVTYLSNQGVTLGTALGQTTYSHASFIPKTIALKSGTYNINTPQTLVFDQHSLFVTEIKDAKAAIEAQLDPYISGFTASSYVWGGGYYGDNAVAYAMTTMGFDQVRGVRGVGTDGTTYKTTAMQLYSTGSAFADTDIGTVDPEAQAELYLNVCTQTGGVCGMHGHGTSFTVANWTSVFKAAAKTPNLQVMTFDDAFDWVRAHDDHIAANVSYLCSDNGQSCLVDAFSYRLRPVSPLIDAGLDAGLTSDYSGRATPQGSAFDIGPYEAVFGLTPETMNILGLIP